MVAPSKLTVSESQDDLFARARAGDQDAWSTLFHECYPKVRRAVRQRIKGPLRRYVDSTDIFNDAFSDLARNAARLNLESVDDVRRFLFDAAYKRVIDEDRRRKTQKRDASRERPLRDADGGDAWGISSGQPTPSQVAVANEVDQQLLDEADEVGRIVIERKRAQYGNDEISREVGWSLRRVQRFLEKLRTTVQN